MKLAIAKTAAQLQSYRPEDKTILFVPTMGALHAGHISLIEIAKQMPEAYVVASIFVNPTQFGEGEDFDQYPRTLDEDIEKLETIGIDLLFLPDISTIYPDGINTTISIPELSSRWEGEHRPGHFDGVATVVARLFELVQPDVVVFGKKDFQQLIIIKHMIESQDLDINILAAPTIRETDGLAMSSRNRYLSEEERKIAPKLYKVLLSSQRKLGSMVTFETNKEMDPSFRWDDEAKHTLLNAGFDKVDYFALVDGQTLEPITEPALDAVIIAAAWLGNTRLIDNIGFNE